MKKAWLILLVIILSLPVAQAVNGPVPRSATSEPTAYRWPTPDYNDMLRNPDKYVGNSFYTVEGTVLGVSESVDRDFQLGSGSTLTVICIQPDGDNVTPVYLFRSRQWGEPRILEGDLISATAMAEGISAYFDYEYPFTDTLPLFYIQQMSVNGENYPPQ